MHTRSLLVSCAYVSIESTDFILLLSFELKVILLISSVKTLCFSLLNICYFLCWFVVLYEFLKIFLKTICFNFIFLTNGLFYFQFGILLNSFYNLQILLFFLWNIFLCLLLFCLHRCCLLGSYMFFLLIRQILAWFVHLNHFLLIQLLFKFFL